MAWARAQAVHGRPRVWAAQLWRPHLLPVGVELGSFLWSPAEPCAGGQCPAGSWPGSGVRWAVPTPVHAVSVGTTCSLELIPCPLFEGPTRLPRFASPGGPWPWMVLGAVTSRAGKGIANSRKQACIGCLMMGDPHDGDKQEGDGDAPRFSDSFLDKLSTGVGSILQHP